MPKYVVGTMGGAVHTVLEEKVIPPGRYFPMCGMNLAFTREIAPAMYFLLMGRVVARVITTGVDSGKQSMWTMQGVGDASGTIPLPFDRFGDIWAGILAKRICDHLGLAVRSGSPHVLHERASDPLVNLRKEAPGIAENEYFWRRVDAVRLRGETVAECYGEIAKAMAEWDGEHAAYWRTLSEAMRVWVRLLGA